MDARDRPTLPLDRARRDWHRNDHAGDLRRTHLVRLPDRSLVRADRYVEALVEWEDREVEAGELADRDRPSARLPEPLRTEADELRARRRRDGAPSAEDG